MSHADSFEFAPLRVVRSASCNAQRALRNAVHLGRRDCCRLALAVDHFCAPDALGTNKLQPRGSYADCDDVTRTFRPQ